MTDFLISNRTRRIVLSGFFFFTGICFASWASRIPDIKMQLGLNDAELGAMLLFLPVGSFLGIPISGSLIPFMAVTECSKLQLFYIRFP
jgi:hypothetical protein